MEQRLVFDETDDSPQSATITTHDANKPTDDVVDRRLLHIEEEKVFIEKVDVLLKNALDMRSAKGPMWKNRERSV